MLIVGIGQPPTNIISINSTILTASDWTLLFQAMVRYATTPAVYNVTCTNAGTEYSQALPANVKKFMIKPRGTGNIKACFTSGQSGTTYIGVVQGAAYNEDLIMPSSITLYFQSDTAGQIVEIVAWS